MASRVAVGMTGATGQIYGISALELLAETDYEVHLILSDAAKVTIPQETTYTEAEVCALADVVHSNDNIGAETASGSFDTEGLLVAPCSMRTLASIAHGMAGNLITRSADVALKERRSLVVMPREKPFNRIHLENMLAVTDAGGVVMPPFPSLYQNPDSFQEMVDRTVVRTLSQLGIDLDLEEWAGLEPPAEPK